MLKPILMEVLDWGGHARHEFFILSFDLVDACVKVVLWSLGVLSLLSSGEPRHSGLRFLQNFVIVHLIMLFGFPIIGWFSHGGAGSCSRSMGRVDLDSFRGPILHKLEHHGLRRFHIYDGDRRWYCRLVSGQKIFSPCRIQSSVLDFPPEISFVFAALIHAEVGVELFVFENLILLIETQVFVFFLSQVLEIGSSSDLQELASDFVLFGRYARFAVPISLELLDGRDSTWKIILLHLRS